MTAATADLVNSTRAEFLRLRRWPAVWVTLGVWVFLALMFGYLFTYFFYRTGDLGFPSEGSSAASIFAELLPAAVPDVLLQGMPMFGGAPMLVLGGLVAGNGYGWGTWKTVFTQGPSRRTVIAGSMLTLTAFVVAVVLLTSALCFAVSTTIALTEGADLVWPAAGSVLQSVLAGCLVLELWALAGFAAGTLARAPVLAVGLGLVWVLVIENLLRGVGSLLSPVESLTHVLPGTAAGSLVGALIGVESGGGPGGGPGSGGVPGVLDLLSATRATWTIVAYLAAFILITLALTGRRDVVASAAGR